MRTSAPVRYIKPETICIGDVIRVTTKHKDIETSVVGRVARREVYNYSTDYITNEGVTILEHFRYTGSSATVTLLERANNVTVLEGLF